MAIYFIVMFLSKFGVLTSVSTFPVTEKLNRYCGDFLRKIANYHIGRPYLQVTVSADSSQINTNKLLWYHFYINWFVNYKILHSLPQDHNLSLKFLILDGT